MADIRKRDGKKPYQVRFLDSSTKSGYGYKSFTRLKDANVYKARKDLEEGGIAAASDIRTVPEATDLWLRICEKEGLNGREPVTNYTLKNYEYRAGFITTYGWKKNLIELTAPDVVEFRSWLLGQDISRDLAGKVLSSFQSVMKEMSIRGIIPHNVATGICIRADSRYQEPVIIPSKGDVLALLRAADDLANEKNQTIAKAWRRYRPMMYLAADSGMRPQEYIALSNAAIRERGVFVDRALDGSGKKISVTKTPAGRRFIDLSPATLDLINHYAKHHATSNRYDLVFPAQSGKWVSRRNWQRRGFNIACERAGLMEEADVNGKTVSRPKYRPYDLRHFFASMLIEKNVNLKKLQSLMGHTNIETTLNVYGHLLEDESLKAEDLGLIGNLMEKSCGEGVASSL